MNKYYFDSCIWRDYFENRSDKFRPLIIYSDIVEEELNVGFSKEEVKNIISVVPKENIIKINVSKEQLREAIQVSKELNIPTKDALHAIVARNNNAILVTRDKHFYELQNQVEIKKPEDLI